MIMISKFESVCQKVLVLYRNWRGKPDEDHRQRHNRSQDIASGHLSNLSVIAGANFLDHPVSSY